MQAIVIVSKPNKWIKTNAKGSTMWHELYRTIHTKSLIITPMYFYETNMPSRSIKEHVNPIANASQTQWSKNTQSIKECEMSTDQKVLPTA